MKPIDVIRSVAFASAIVPFGALAPAAAQQSTPIPMGCPANGAPSARLEMMPGNAKHTRLAFSVLLPEAEFRDYTLMNLSVRNSQHQTVATRLARAAHIYKVPGGAYVRAAYNFPAPLVAGSAYSIDLSVPAHCGSIGTPLGVFVAP